MAPLFGIEYLTATYLRQRLGSDYADKMPRYVRVQGAEQFTLPSSLPADVISLYVLHDWSSGAGRGSHSPTTVLRSSIWRYCCPSFQMMPVILSAISHKLLICLGSMIILLIFGVYNRLTLSHSAIPGGWVNATARLTWVTISCASFGFIGCYLAIKV